jgi:hypothetical protein
LPSLPISVDINANVTAIVQSRLFIFCNTCYSVVDLDIHHGQRQSVEWQLLSIVPEAKLAGGTK